MILSRLATATGFFSSARTDLFKLLSNDSDMLKSLSKQFVERAKHLQIVSFYERIGLESPSTMVC
jgi:hypothetical protein